MSVDRRALKILLAALEMEQRDLASDMGYDVTYVANVVNGFTEPSDAFKRAFGDVVADVLLGPARLRHVSYPAEPLRRLIAQRAMGAPSKARFYADLGLTSQGWGKRQTVPASLVDRVCCALGVHPSAIYPEFTNIEEAS